MTYTVTDIAELIHYHLVLATDSDRQADDNLAELVSHVQFLRTEPLFHQVQWVHCDQCGCSVDSDLISENGAGGTSEDEFLCSSCRWPDEE
ncbi:MAG: hypothetical protein ACLQRH_27365 [Acidimicrobiales bacterium]